MDEEKITVQLGTMISYNIMFNFQNLHEYTICENVHPPTTRHLSCVMCQVSCVRCHVSGVTCQVSHFMCHMSGVT